MLSPHDFETVHTAASTATGSSNRNWSHPGSPDSLVDKLGRVGRLKGVHIMSKPHPSAFRRKTPDLLESGQSVREVAESLGVFETCLHR